MKNKISLPFWETIRRSFMYLLLNFNSFLKISAVWMLILIFEIATNFPSLCSLNSSTCESSPWPNVSMALLSLSGICIIIAFCRQIILKENYKGYFNFKFGMRELRYILNSILYLLAIVVPGFLAGVLIGVAFGLSGIQTNQYMPLLMILIFCYVVFSARLYLVFPAVSVDNKEIGFRKSFEITAGNANKIFWGQVLVMLPIFVTLLSLSVIYRAIGSDNFVIKLFFSALVLMLSFLDAGFKASYFAHIYQYFMYFHNKETKTEQE